MTFLPAFAGYHSYNLDKYTNHVLMQLPLLKIKSLIRYFVRNVYYAGIRMFFSNKKSIMPALQDLKCPLLRNFT